MSKLDTASFNHILADFNYLTTLFFFTDKCGPKEISRFEDAARRATGRINLQEFLIK